MCRCAAIAGLSALYNIGNVPATVSLCKQRGMELIGNHSSVFGVSFARDTFGNFLLLGCQVCLLCAVFFIDNLGAAYVVVFKFS